MYIFGCCCGKVRIEDYVVLGGRKIRFDLIYLDLNKIGFWLDKADGINEDDFGRKKRMDARVKN